MFTAKQAASTLDEYQGANMPQIEHRWYYYFPFQDNSQITTPSRGILWSSEIPTSISCSIRIGAEGATVSSVPYESNCEQILLLVNSLHIIQAHIQTHSHHEVFDTASDYPPQISTGDFKVEQRLTNIIESYQHEEFDSYIAYEFTNALDSLIRDNGKPAISIINNQIKKHILDADIISETLKALGRIEDDNTKYERFELLIDSTENESATIRDGALSGLSFLDDKRALPQLRMLFETETVPILKNNIKIAIKGLEY